LVVAIGPIELPKLWAYVPTAILGIFLIISLIIPERYMPWNLSSLTQWAPFAAVLMASRWFEKHSDNGMKLTSLPLMVFFIIQIIFIGLVFLQPDLSTSLIMAVLILVCIILAGLSLRDIGLILLINAFFMWLVVLIFPIARVRFGVYIYGLKSVQNASYHIQTALSYIAKGGLFGTGFGTTTFPGLPVPYSDSVFATIVTHLGSIGAFFILLLYGVLVFWGFQTAKNSLKTYNKVLAGGLTSYIALEVLWNTMSITGLLPNLATSLPLFSYGGMKTIITMISLGLLVNIAKENAIMNIDTK
jgi:cell division protein FtsW (lipid II flippase)